MGSGQRKTSESTPPLQSQSPAPSQSDPVTVKK
jgi:hypothetical protein